jgi:solute carrier family 25 protein 38
MTGLTQLRAFMATSPHFSVIQENRAASVSVLPVLTSHGNLIAGATTRVAVGIIVNPFSVIKARFEVWRQDSLVCV